MAKMHLQLCALFLASWLQLNSISAVAALDSGKQQSSNVELWSSTMASLNGTSKGRFFAEHLNIGQDTADKRAREQPGPIVNLGEEKSTHKKDKKPDHGPGPVTDESTGSSVGIIIGAVAGVLVLLICVVLIVCCCCCGGKGGSKSKSKRKSSSRTKRKKSKK